MKKEFSIELYINNTLLPSLMIFWI